MEEERGTRLFASSRMHRDIIFRAAVTLVLNMFRSVCTDHSVLYDGLLLCYNPRFNDLSRFMETICMQFARLVSRYERLNDESAYLANKEDHERYLHLVAATAMCSVYINNPLLLKYEGDNSYIDLSPLPWWIKKVIKRLSFPTYGSMDVRYHPYSKIEEE